MNDNEAPDAGGNAYVNFEASAVLRKWPSLNNQPRGEAFGPYLLLKGSLDRCIRKFMAKPSGSRHLHEIHTPHPPLVSDVMAGENLAELARLRGLSLNLQRRVGPTLPSPSRCAWMLAWSGDHQS